MAPESDLVELLLSDQWSGQARPVREIHSRDEMLRRDLWNPEQAEVEYFHTGLVAARVWATALDWQQKRLRRPLRVLDFASGYGRVTRFLTTLPQDLEIWVSELEPTAVEFQKEALGVEGFVSALAPEDLVDATPGGFDLVLVASFFSHLPASTFGGWLKRLGSWLSPDGLLAFSVQGENVLPGVFEMPPAGLFFEPASELEHRIGVEDYGRTWVSERFVREAVAKAFRTTHPPCRVDRALWHYQDLWLASSGADPSPLAAEIDAGPDGRLYGAYLEPGGRLKLEGWAVHPGQPERELEILVSREGERLASATPTEPRPDVTRHYGAEGEWNAGWSVTVDLAAPGATLRTALLVKVVDSRGLARVLHLGSVETLLADQRLREVGAELAACRAELKEARGEAAGLREEVGRAERSVSDLKQKRVGRLRRWWSHG